MVFFGGRGDCSSSVWSGAFGVHDGTRSAFTRLAQLGERKVVSEFAIRVVMVVNGQCE